jgi:hypothetical protein
MFKETQLRKIDLEEDDPSMVELLVKFFYTFDYDNTPMRSDNIGLHARVYTIADKYEVLGLKSIALARFKEGLVESHKDGDAMVQATRTLAECLPPPTCDTVLHDLMVKAWILGGDALFLAVGEAEISSLFTEMTWLSAAFATRMLKRMKPGPICGHCKDLISQADCLHKRERDVLSLRGRLQKGFFPHNQSPKEEDMSDMNKYLGQLERHGNIESYIIESTKIHTILKLITRLASIPKDAEFRFKRRSAKLLGIYTKRLEHDGQTTQSIVGQ